MIGDGSPPVWLENVLSSLGGSPSAAEQGFLAVLCILLYESGFFFIDGPGNSTPTYDAGLMRRLSDSTLILSHIQKKEPTLRERVVVFSHKLMHPETVKLIAYCVVPETTLVVNFLIPRESLNYSYLFDIRSYFSKDSNQLRVVDTKCKDLSVLIKTFLYTLKASVCGEMYHSHHILALPFHVLHLLCKFLDGRTFLQFISTCRYLHDNFRDDESLWKYYSSTEFRGLNKKATETWQTHYKYQKSVNSRLFPRHLPFDRYGNSTLFFC